MIPTNKIWVRFLVIFLIHIVIKSFDLSFPNGPFATDYRSLFFSVYFMLYGTFLWYFAEWFDNLLHKWIKKPEKSRTKTLIFAAFHALFAFAIMFTVNHFYRLSDIYIFNKAQTWENIPLLNPELIVSLVSFYLIIYGFNSYLQIHNELQEQKIKQIQLKKENISAQYQALKAQIEPHFLFNSLSVLSSLVYEDADLSSDFILKLSKTLRYIIEKNEVNLVKLSEEMEFLQSYFFLIKTRLDDGVFLVSNLDNDVLNSAYIPPVTLQLLVENAIKHNKYNPKNPLKITINKQGEYILVKNNLNERTTFNETTRLGLKNIRKRFEIISNKHVEVEKTDSEFTVKIPLLNLKDYESFTI